MASEARDSVLNALALAAERLSTSDLTQMTGFDPQAIRKALRQLRDEGRADCVPDPDNRNALLWAGGVAGKVWTGEAIARTPWELATELREGLNHD